MDKFNPENHPQPEREKSPHTSDYLANERTFLAWIRTSIAVISLGFVIARFSFWLTELALSTGQHLQVQRTGLSLPIGLGTTLAPAPRAGVGFGALLTVLAAYRYRGINRAISRGEVYSSQSLIWLVTFLTVILALVLIGYLLVASGSL
jgi:putative membrane protein